MSHNIKDLTGMRFGKLTVLKYSGRSTTDRGRIWICKCDCGNIREVPTGRLTAKNGHVRACVNCAKGVLHKRGVRLGQIGVVKRRERLHNIWMLMKRRCCNPNSCNYMHYGGRGITVCQEWRDSYDAFKGWALSNGYKDDLTIERIDVDGNYCPENCKFVTMREQGYNKRETKFIEYDGKKIPLAKFVYDLGLAYGSISHYLRTYKA